MARGDRATAARGATEGRWRGGSGASGAEGKKSVTTCKSDASAAMREHTRELLEAQVCFRPVSENAASWWMWLPALISWDGDQEPPAAAP